jgi:hypothetical protein
MTASTIRSALCSSRCPSEGATRWCESVTVGFPADHTNSTSSRPGSVKDARDGRPGSELIEIANGRLYGATDGRRPAGAAVGY